MAPLTPLYLSTYLILLSALSTPTTLRQFQVGETYNEVNKIIGTGNCSLDGCWLAVIIPLAPASVTPCSYHAQRCPYVCFPFDNSRSCLKWVDYYGGCLFWSCNIHGVFNIYNQYNSSYPPRKQYFSGLGSVKFTIYDPWNNRWATEVTRKLYYNTSSSSPKANIFISRQLVPVPKAAQTQNKIAQQEQASLALASPPSLDLSSWPVYLRYPISLLNQSSILPNTSGCFLCTSLNRPFLTATTLNYKPSDLASLPNSSSSAELPPLTSVPLYTKSLIPQLTLYGQGKFQWLISPTRIKRAVFLPLVIGIRLTTSIGLAGGALGHSLHTAGFLEEQLQQSLDFTAESLQQQITSLVKVILQNRHALDLLTAGKGGICLALQEE
ncbi:ERV-BabFcenv provirus ancestral Env polyprotein-like [Erinaceus europaeus]|uniref:ERV-BabFcenv provirus ancestral Env polyprotein-like n=1 Tax=Erinaceus europaeus TaxID=9365 RepID=A0ABM3YBN2_ERIEU|nr:ERV-BabFcenv provirus ancestral Env polyprotein-like [Erinaceus europaeus]